MFHIYDPKSISAYKQPPAAFPPAIDAACQAIHKACKGFGTDESELIRVLTSISPYERELCAMRYKSLHGQELRDLLKSEASGDFGFLLQLLSVRVVDADALVLREATRGAGTTERYIYPVRRVLLCTESVWGE